MSVQRDPLRMNPSSSDAEEVELTALMISAYSVISLYLAELDRAQPSTLQLLESQIQAM